MLQNNVHARGGVVLVMSGTNPESKNTVQQRRVLAAIRQITPAARPIKKLRQTKILLDNRCCQMKEYQIKEVQPVMEVGDLGAKWLSHHLDTQYQVSHNVEFYVANMTDGLFRKVLTQHSYTCEPLPDV